MYFSSEPAVLYKALSDWGVGIVPCLLKMRKLRHTVIEWLAQGHTGQLTGLVMARVHF